jgi:hypothetical protein
MFALNEWRQLDYLWIGQIWFLLIPSYIIKWIPLDVCRVPMADTCLAPVWCLACHYSITANYHSNYLSNIKITTRLHKVANTWTPFSTMLWFCCGRLEDRHHSKLDKFTMVSQLIRLILVDWFVFIIEAVFHFLIFFEVIFHFFFQVVFHFLRSSFYFFKIKLRSSSIFIFLLRSSSNLLFFLVVIFHICLRSSF